MLQETRFAVHDPHLPLLRCLMLLALLLGTSIQALWAQTEPPSPKLPFEKGEVIDRVTCRTNPEQSYALFLPSAYTPARRWPIVYAFDPVARGSVPVKMLKEVAEEYGYIVVGSNNSRNGPLAPQQAAAEALWNDTHLRFAIDNRRIYVTGFSGGARFATFLALECDCVTGVIGHGAGLPDGLTTPPQPEFHYFAAIGDLDFNYPELVRLGPYLDELGFTNRIRRFPGPHQWAPREVWAEAIEWMELLAMKEGLRGRDEQFIAQQLTVARQRAQELEKAGELYGAHYEYRKLAEEFEELADASLLARKAAELAETEAVRAGRKREQEEIKLQESLTEEFRAHLVALRTRPAERRTILFQLHSKVRELRDRLRIEGEGERGKVLQRTLRKIFALAYEAGEAGLRSNDPSRAADYFEAASYVATEYPMPFFQLARAHAQAGNKKAALRALRQAVEKGFKSAALLRETREFAALQDDPDFRRILAGLAPQPPP